MLVGPPQSSPPLLPAPPFTSPVEVEGKLYIAQETFGTANKQMLETMRRSSLDVLTHARGTSESLVEMGRQGGHY